MSRFSQIPVIAAYKEPIPGWVDNLNGPTGILVGAGKGVIRTMHCNASLDADIVPVDIVINRLIIIARELGLNRPKKEPAVYNLTNDAVRDYLKKLMTMNFACLIHRKIQSLGGELWT